MIVFPSLNETLEIHQRILAKFGGAPGVRDLGLLESVLYRPQCGYYETIEDMATAMLESLYVNHPFVDGNKRVAFFTTDVFLRMNGLKLKLSANSGYDFLTNHFSRQDRTFDELKNWLIAHKI